MKLHDQLMALAGCLAVAGCLASVADLEKLEGEADAGIGGSEAASGGQASGGGPIWPSGGGTGNSGGTGGGGSVPTAGGGGANGGSSGGVAGQTGTGAATGTGGASTCGNQSQCVSPAPAGWNGPFVLYDDKSTGGGSCTVPATCPSDLPVKLLQGTAGLQPSSATCSPCSCGPVQGNCVVSLSPSATLNCGGGCATWSAAKDACVGVSCGGIQTVKSLGATSSLEGAQCTPAPQVPQKPAPVWDRHGLGCGADQNSGASCADGKICLANASACSAVCISKAGDQACPAPFSDKRVFYQGVVDTRSCTACTCGAPTGAWCTGTYAAGTSSSCGGTSYSFLDGCNQSISGTLLWYKHNLIPNPAGKCAAGGGSPSGSVTPSNPVTACCLKP